MGTRDVMAVASGPAGPVLAGPVLTLAFKTAHALGYVHGRGSARAAAPRSYRLLWGGGGWGLLSRPLIARPPVHHVHMCNKICDPSLCMGQDTRDFPLCYGLPQLPDPVNHVEFYLGIH